MLKVIGITLICGTLFTLLGTLLAMALQKENKKLTSSLLAFSSGSMLSIVFIDLLNELLELSETIQAGLYIGIGIVLVVFVLILVLHQSIDRCSHHGECHVDEEHQICHDRAHAQQFVDSIEEGKHFIQAGLILLVAMCIHNFPEGISLGVTFSLKEVSGYTFAILIGIHNIIVGLSIAMPFIQAKMKKRNIFFISFLSSVPMLVGAILGYYFGNLSAVALLIVVSISIAAILYVVFKELLPQAYSLSKSPYLSLILILGILVGVVLLAL